MTGQGEIQEDGSRARSGLGLGSVVDDKNGKLRSDSGAGVEDNVVYGSRARRQIALMPLVETGDQTRSEHGNVGPTKGPSRA